MASHVSQGMTRANSCVKHGKPCVHMHANGHAYKLDVFVEGGRSKKGKEKGGKGEKGKGEKKEKKGKGKEREKGEGGRWFLPQFIGVLMVGTRWTKK